MRRSTPVYDDRRYTTTVDLLFGYPLFGYPLHRFEATIRAERRRITFRLTLGGRLDHLTDDRNSLGVPLSGRLGQRVERHASRPIDPEVNFEFIVPMLDLCTLPAMARKQRSCFAPASDGSINDLLFRPTFFPCPATIVVFPCPATIVALLPPVLDRRRTPVIGVPCPPIGTPVIGIP